MTQTPLYRSNPYGYVFSTKRNKYLTSRGTWTDQIRLADYFPVDESWVERCYKEKYPEEEIEIHVYQLQYVKLN